MGTTALTASMAVNALVTGLIVFKILKVFLEVSPILAELTLDNRGEQTSAHHICNNRIRHDVVRHPSDSPCVLDPANGVDHCCW